MLNTHSFLRRHTVFLTAAVLMCCSSGILRSQVRVSYSYPAPNATQVSARTTVGIRYADPITKSFLRAASFIVIGSQSAVHSGKVVLAGDMRTVIFFPDRFFTAGEIVTVTANPLFTTKGKLTAIYHFSFQISKSKVLPFTLDMKQNSSSGDISLVTDNALAAPLPSNFPTLEIRKDVNPSPGHFFLSNFTYVRSTFGTYLMILDNSGNVLFQRSTAPLGAQNFTLQPNGLFTYFDQYANTFYGMDSNFTIIDTFAAANGYATDYHELCFLPDGGYALLATYNEKADLRQISGDSDAIVTHYVLQQFDRDKNLIFEWRTADSGHFAITDDETPGDLSLHTIDYAHCNSIEFDPSDSTFLLSSRSLDEITKIDLEDGSIIWRLGGKHNQFMFSNEAVPFSHQHDVRRLADGNITLFDNGNYRKLPVTYSRGVEYSLDEKSKTITKVWEYRHTPDIYAEAMGSVQRLANGNTVIGWGLSDSTGVAITEVQPDGSTAFELSIPTDQFNYRAYKYTNDHIASSVGSSTPASRVSLGVNYPNPFSASTVIMFTVAGFTPAKLIVYDALGREVRTLFDGSVEAGEYSARFDAAGLSDGVYICKLITSSESQSKAIILAK
jgi:hypothetical protein